MALRSRKARFLWYASRLLVLSFVVVPAIVTAGILYTIESPNAAGEGGSFGRSVAAAGDVNGDTYADLIVGAPYEDGGADRAGRAYVFSGQGGEPLHTLESCYPDPFGHFGGSVFPAGDVNNDGFDDVVVGAGAEDGSVSGSGYAYVYSGNRGTLLHTLESPWPELHGALGYAVAGAGDINGDEYADILIGASCEDGGGLEAGRAYVFDPTLETLLLSGMLGGTELELLWTPLPGAAYYRVYGHQTNPSSLQDKHPTTTNGSWFSTRRRSHGLRPPGLPIQSPTGHTWSWRLTRRRRSSHAQIGSGNTTTTSISSEKIRSRPLETAISICPPHVGYDERRRRCSNCLKSQR